MSCDRTAGLRSHPDFSAVDWMNCLPNVITLAIGLSISHKTRTSFIQISVAVGAFEAACMPFEVGCNAEDVLILNLRAATDTHGYSTLLCNRNTKQNLRAPWFKRDRKYFRASKRANGVEGKFILTNRESHRVKYIRWRSWSLIPEDASQGTLGDISQNGITN